MEIDNIVIIVGDFQSLLSAIKLEIKLIRIQKTWTTINQLYLINISTGILLPTITDYTMVSRAHGIFFKRENIKS